MSYDYGIKQIAKLTKISGVEAKNIAKTLEAKGLDFQTFDWKTIGEDLYGHGNRTAGIKGKIQEMYGINIAKPDIKEFDVMEHQSTMADLMAIHNRRSKKSIIMDLAKDAKQKFKPNDAAGVKKWKKHPNRYDIIGIDDLI